jgi:predicted transport protein
MSRVAEWVRRHTETNEDGATRMTVPLPAAQHEALQRIAGAVGMTKTACATHLLVEAIQDALAELEASGDFVCPSREATSSRTLYARLKGNTSMDQLYHQLEVRLRSLGDDVEVRPTKGYVGFWHTAGETNQVFAYVHIKRTSITIDVEPKLPLQPGFVEVVAGHRMTRRITISTVADLEVAMPLLRDCYDDQ